MSPGRCHKRSLLQKSIIAFFCILAQLLLIGSSYGDDRTEAIKAAYVYNFAKFTYWTHLSDDAPLHIQIIGRHPFGDSLTPVTSKTVVGHTIQIETLSDFNPERSLQILFIAKDQEAVLPSILKAVKHKKILTISDIAHFTGRGGIIGLIEKENTIRFTINLDAARLAGIELNSQMIRLAESVISNPVSR